MKMFFAAVMMLALVHSPPVSGAATGRSSEEESNSGPVFTRWGRRDCPESSELVYTGVAAGSHYKHKGSGSNYLCLPDDPIYQDPVEKTQATRAMVYAAEYETNDFPPLKALHDYNAPCAVCQATGRVSMLMIPARNVCPPSWTKEYSGYLMSQQYTLDKSEFICMDVDATGISRSNYNENGALFHPTEGRCGKNGSGLPCTPYIDGYELTCAVCTK